jgi:hypothetical protein
MLRSVFGRRRDRKSARKELTTREGIRIEEANALVNNAGTHTQAKDASEMSTCFNDGCNWKGGNPHKQKLRARFCMNNG